MQIARRRTSTLLSGAVIGSLLFCFTAASPCICAAKDEPTAEPWPVGRTIFAATALEKRVRSALAQPLTQELKNVTLAELAKFLEERLKCTVYVDEPALTSGADKADQLDLQLKYSLHVGGGSLQDELRRLPKYGRSSSDPIVFLVRDECLWITSRNSAEMWASLRIYPVHDLVVDPDGRTSYRSDLAQLGELVQASCGDGWRQNGGSVYAELRAFEGAGILALAVVQTDEGHEQVERFLGQLRSAKIEELRRAQLAAKPELVIHQQVGISPRRMNPLPPPPRLPRGKAIDVRPAAERKILDLLKQPAKLEFVDKPLGEITAALEKQFGFTVRLDSWALTADGKGPESKLTLRWLDGELRNALALLLEQHGLTYLVRDEALVVTTKTASETVNRTVLYQIHDLIAHDGGLIGRRADFESYREFLTAVVAPETWTDGWDVRGYEAAGLQVLAVVQGDRQHAQVEALFDLLREAYEPKVYQAQRLRPALAGPPPKPPVTQSPQQPGLRGTGGNFFNVQP